MFINRPLIHGIAQNDLTTRRSKSIKDSKGNIRVKTLPSQSGKKSIKNSFNRVNNDGSIIDNNLIGIKGIKQLIDIDIKSLLQQISQFQSITIDEQNHIQKKYKKQQQKSSSTTISHNNNNITKLSQNEIRLQQQQQRAYNQCRQILQMRDQQQEKMFVKINQSVVIKIYQLQEMRLELGEIVKSTSQSIQQIKSQIIKKQHQIKLYRKKHTIKHKIKQQIQQQRTNIQAITQQLFTCKQQSLKQKNDFIQIQAQQIRLIKQIQHLQQQQQKHKQSNQEYQYYKKIQKLRDKLLNSKNKQSNQIDEFFQQKIDDIIKLRVKNDHIQRQVVQLQAKVEEQLAIIQMLQKRNLSLEKIQEQQQNDNLSKLYRHKYEKLFLNKYNHGKNIQKNNKELQQQEYSDIINNENNHHHHDNDNDQYRQLNHWQNYKSYLQKILKNQKKLNQQRSLLTDSNHNDSASFIITTKANSQVFKDGYNGDDRRRGNRIMDELMEKRRREKKINSTNLPSRVNKQYYTSMKNSSLLLQRANTKPKKQQYKIQQQSKPRSSLPKLVKMQGNLKDKDKIKNQLTKFTNMQYDEDIELQTVRTSQADGQQEVIEVQFKGKRDSSAAVLRRNVVGKY